MTSMLVTPFPADQGAGEAAGDLAARVRMSRCEGIVPLISHPPNLAKSVGAVILWL